jgi:hypothetical protein
VLNAVLNEPWQVEFLPIHFAYKRQEKGRSGANSKNSKNIKYNSAPLSMLYFSMYYINCVISRYLLPIGFDNLNIGGRVVHA